MRHPAGRLVVLAVALLAAPTSLFAQDDGRDQRRKALLEGTHVLRRILFDEGYQALDNFDAIGDDPSRTLVIVLGNLDVLEQFPLSLDRFVHQGGAALLASDRAVTSRDARRQLLAVSGVTVSSEYPEFDNGNNLYKRLPFCPFVYPVAAARPELFPNPEESATAGVATNVPGSLMRHFGVPGVRPVGTLPAGGILRLRGGIVRTIHPLLFAVAGDVGAGRVLVMADHSVFINEMMLPTDNGNAEFATRAVGWLGGEDEPKRNRVLFVEDGRVETKLEIRLKSVTPPPEEIARLLFAHRNEIASAGNDALVRLEQDNAFNRALLMALDRVGLPPGRLGQVALVVGTLALAGFAIYRIGIRGRFRHDTTAPLLALAIDRRLPVATLAHQRQLALLRQSNLAEPAMYLARTWLARLGQEPAGRTGSAREASLPRIDVRGSWWQRWYFNSRLRAVWRRAAGKGGRVSPRGLRALEVHLADLLAAHERGDWRFSPPTNQARV